MTHSIILFIISRVKAAFEELEKMLNDEKDLEEKDEYVKARAVLDDVRIQLSSC
jgi:hypothetical protein